MNLDKVINKTFKSITHSYGRKDTMLYALGVGAGADPMDAVDLRFTYEKELVALPTMASVLSSPGFWMQEPELEIDWVKLLHGEQAIELLRPLPPEGKVHSRYQVIAVRDRGADKGATLWFEKLLVDDSGETISSVKSTYMLRGDGGCGDHGEAPQPPTALPDRAPDTVIEIATLPRQALLYRLNGDYNPLHADPDVARKAGFDQPIMHGLGSMGIVCHQLVRAFADGDPTRVRAMSQRFASPFYPGETMTLDCYKEGSDIRFKATAKERGKVVLDMGTLSLAN